MSEKLLDLSSFNRSEKSSLFYPCCGNDIYDPLKYFNAKVDVFNFCDLRINVNQDTIDTIADILEGFEMIKYSEEYEMKKNSRTGEQSVRFNNRERAIRPPAYVRDKVVKIVQVWENKQSNKEIKIIWYIGDGYKVLANEDLLKVIDIFFYRGDSNGEGGSNIGWLETKKDGETRAEPRQNHFDFVLKKLTDNGLIVTDGSNCGEEYLFLNQSMYKNNKSNRLSEDMIKKEGRRFTKIGEITPKYGPTFIWQVNEISKV